MTASILQSLFATANSVASSTLKSATGREEREKFLSFSIYKTLNCAMKFMKFIFERRFFLFFFYTQFFSSGKDYIFFLFIHGISLLLSRQLVFPSPIRVIIFAADQT